MKSRPLLSLVLLSCFTLLMLFSWYLLCRPDNTAPAPVKVTSIQIKMSSRDTKQDPHALRIGNKLHLKAMANYSDGGIANISDMVNWHSDAPAIVKIDMHGTIQVSQSGNAKLTASYDGIYSAPFSVSVLNSQLVSLAIKSASKDMPTSLNTNTRRQLLAIGTYDDGSQEDLTSQVDWMLTKPSKNAVVDQGLLFTQKAEKVSVIAKIERLSSAPFSLNFVDKLDQECATNNIQLNYKNKRLSFTCPPTQQRYSQARHYFTESGSHGPAGIKVARLNWPKAVEYCKSLGDQYRLPSREELEALYARYPVDSNGLAQIYTQFGWPVNMLFWSSTPYDNGHQHYFVGLYNGGFYNYKNSSRLYVSCVQEHKA